MEKLNIEELKCALRGVGVSSAGTKSDLLARLQTVLKESGMNVGEALEKGERMKESEGVGKGSTPEEGTNQPPPNNDGAIEEDVAEDVSPNDSISQVGRSKQGACSERHRRGKSDETLGRNEKSQVSVATNSSFRSNMSTLERRRELEIDLAMRKAEERNRRRLEMIKEQQSVVKRRAERNRMELELKLKREREERECRMRAEIEEHELKLRKEMEEQEALVERKLAVEINRLEKEARKSAETARLAAVRQFEEIDMLAASNVEAQLKSLDLGRFTEEVRESRQSREMDYRISGRGEGSFSRLGCRDRTGFSGVMFSDRLGRRYEIGREPSEAGNGSYGRVNGREKSGNVHKGRGIEFCTDNVPENVETKRQPKTDNAFIRETHSNNLEICIPKQEIECFDGDVSAYTVFRSAMREINDSTLSSERKLHYAYQYTRGEPRELVKAALHMKAEEGFREVWRWFEEKYGAPEQIGAGYMDKLLMRSPVARDDVEGLRGYAVALRLTMNVMANIPYGKSELEHPKTVRKLVSKLSFGLQDRWRTMSADSKIERGDYLSFEDFVKFVERAVRIDSDPLFGKDALQRISSTNDNRATYKRKPISVNVVSGRKGVRGQVNGDLGVTSSSLESDECVFCRGGHRVNRCDTFLEQNPKQRFDIIREVGGCFICLKAGHLSRNCPNPVACSLCARYHHDLLHFNSGEPRRNFTANRSKEREFNYKEGQVSSKPSPHAKEFVPIGAGVTGRDGHSNYETIIERNVPVNSLASYEAPTVGSMAVVPVVLRNSRGKVVRTSAFLDNGSSISFCTKELLKDLCASPADVLGGEFRYRNLAL